MAEDSMTNILLAAVVAGAAWYLYSNGTLAQWFPTVFQGPAVTPVTPTSSTAAAPATVSVSGPVSYSQSSNSFSATITVNGTAMPVTIGINTGIIQDQYGNNITASLQVEGVSVPSVLAMIESAYSAQTTTSGTSGLAGNRVSMRLIHGGRIG